MKDGCAAACLAGVLDPGRDVLAPGLVDAWYRFAEVKQNWLGFVVDGNFGHGLGRKFARELNEALTSLLSDLGEEVTTESTHVEKVSLIRRGVGRDTISDFSTNLIKHYLCSYTEKFTLEHIDQTQRREFVVPRAVFSYRTIVWMPKTYTLPELESDFVLLTPMDMLTLDDTWINRSDMIGSFDSVVAAVPDEQQRATVSRYLTERLSRSRSRRSHGGLREGVRRVPVERRCLMPAVTHLNVVFVEFVPETLDEGVIYVSLEYGTVVHLCACGCGAQAVTPLGPQEYPITYDGEAVTLRPSVGNWGFECRSHYTVDKGRVTWAGDWTADEVSRNRARDRMAKDVLFSLATAVAEDDDCVSPIATRWPNGVTHRPPRVPGHGPHALQTLRES